MTVKNKVKNNKKKNKKKNNRSCMANFYFTEQRERVATMANSKLRQYRERLKKDFLEADPDLPLWELGIVVDGCIIAALDKRWQLKDGLIPIPGPEESHRLRLSDARNPSTPQEILAELSRDKDDGVRQCVAQNPSTPPEVLAQLARDSNARVRQAAVTGNTCVLGHERTLSSSLRA